MLPSDQGNLWKGYPASRPFITDLDIEGRLTLIAFESFK